MIAQQLCCGPVAAGTRTEAEKNLTRLISARREVGLQNYNQTHDAILSTSTTLPSRKRSIGRRPLNALILDKKKSMHE